MSNNNHKIKVNVPENWRLVPLQEVIHGKPQYGANASAVDYDSGLPRYIRITDINEDGKLSKSDKKGLSNELAQGYILEKDDFLFARTGATVGKTYLYDEKDGLAAYAGYLIRFKLNKEYVLPNYLSQVTHSKYYYDWIKGTLREGAQPNINAQEYSNFIFPLPPLPEQQKIADILSSVDEAISKTEEIIEQTEKVKKGLMKELLTKGIGHTKFKQTEIGEIPEEWEVKKVYEIANVEYGISESVSSNTDRSIGIPIITGANITLDGNLDMSKTVYIEPKNNPRFALESGDLLFNWRSGSQKHVGKTAVFDLDGTYTYASFILRVRVFENQFNRYYYYLLNYLKETEYFFKDTAVQVNFKLNAATFRQLNLVVPPKEEQEKIVVKLDSIVSKLKIKQKKLTQLQTLKKGLMQDLLTGKVRVKLDN